MRVTQVVLLVCGLAWSCLSHSAVTEGVASFNSGRYAQARGELTEPAEQGDAQAMAYMGEMLMRGLGGARDELKAREYINSAHAAGNIRATYLLGSMHLIGNLVVRDETRGIELVRQAADNGESAAQTAVGSWLANGTRGYDKDEVAALAWFSVAANQQNGTAMGWLGNFAEIGRGGVPQDYLVALNWYKKGGELGHAASLSAAGRMYALGRGVAPDGNEALRWLRRAAAANHLEAYQWIASVYEFGRGGVARNPVLAYAWYGAIPSNASAVVIKNGKEGKERLAKLLSTTELQAAERQSRTVAVQNALTVAALRIAGAGASTPRSGVYGSGVVVTSAGDIVTNAHVINNCGRLRIQPLGLQARIVARDSRNDLALLRVEGGDLPPVRLRAGRNVRLGDDVIAIGYPLKGVLSSGAVVTMGIVNAMTGFGDDSSTFQISATVQPGSSGGPIFDRSGNLVGIVQARLPSTTAANPQNVNFGINLATVASFLDSHSVNYQTAQSDIRSDDTAGLVEQARRSTVQVECY